ncbi:unnamed protein product [marine sediment metagenome]|uniref:DUF5131 family protein n=1 Tax=marine sediment metagenome TaxID=412755 RepID=X1GEP5_9ZZZZ
MKNKIGWCNTTWNPVWGCNNRDECKKYCYARIFAKRFWRSKAKSEYKDYICEVEEGEDAYDLMRLIRDLGDRLRFFIPTFIHSNFEKPFPKKPQRIFIGSMSEIAHWEKRWMEDLILDKIKEYPQHTFIFLTKYPSIYRQYDFPENCWLGVTITKNPKDGESGRWDYYEYKQHNKGNLKFVCYEPLLMQMQLIYYLNLEGIDWVIVGAETGKRKGKVIPKKAWIEDIVDSCRKRGIPIYLKDSLKEIYPEEIKMFPEEK